MTTTKIWNSGLEYVLCAAFESGVGVENIELRLSVSGVTGEPEAQRLAADLVKCGARVTRENEMLIVTLNNEHASKLLAGEDAN